MNIILFPMRNKIAWKATDLLVEHYNPEKVFLVANKKTQNAVHFNCKEKYVVDTYEYDYSEKISANEIIPLDTEILEKFEPFLDTALHMAGRVKNKYFLFDIGYDKRMEIILAHLTYWNTLIEKQEIDLFVDHNVPHLLLDYLIYSLCKMKNIPTLFLFPTKIPGYSYFSKDIRYPCPQITSVYEALKIEYDNASKDDIVLCEDFEAQYKILKNKNTNRTPSYMNKTDKVALEKTRLASKGNLSLRDHLYLFTLPPRFFLRTLLIPLNNRPKYLMKQATNKYLAEWNRCCGEIDLTKKFVYFPLQLQPEATTTPMAGYYTHQELSIKMLAKYLPDDVCIYVKENPKQIYKYRTMEFPKQLTGIPKVKLVPNTYDTFKLIDNCVAVSSATGTALWEGLFQGKPSFMFGYVLTQWAPGIYHIQTNEDCKKAVDAVFNQMIKHTLKDLKLFMLAIEKISFLGILHDPNLFYTKLEIEKRATESFNAIRKEIDTLL